MKPHILTAIALASSALLPVSAFAHDPAAQAASTAAPAMEAEFERIMDVYPADEPGVSVIMMRGDEVIFSGSRGIANAATGDALTPDTVFRYASISKQFAAATIMQMVDEGLLSLDDPLSKFVPDFPNGENITVLQLLNHTSGIKSYTGIPGWMVEANTARAFSTQELIAEFADQPVDFAPGASFSYNNSAYILVGAVIEAVSGRPWYEEVDRRIAQPLGLTTLGYRVDESAVPGFATGYTRDGDDAFGTSQAVHASVPGPAGALSGTVGDLATWARALHGGQVVSDASYELMTTRTTYGDGEISPFGLGLVMQAVRGSPGIGHSGGIFGFSTNSIYLPEHDLFVAIFANTDSPVVDPGTTMRRLAASAIGKPYPDFTRTDVDMAALAPYFGEYTIDEGATRQFYERDGQLYTMRTGSNESKVYAAGDNRFFYGVESLTWFELVTGDDDQLRMEMHHNGGDEAEIAVRTGGIPDAPAVAVSAEQLASYAGSYESQIGVMVLAVNEDGQLTGKLGPQPALPLFPVTETEFGVQGVDARVAIVVDEGAVTGLVIKQGGQELPFTRLPDAD
ncbi:serine hydrolase [Paraurantiacibacter namhicola]|uniref:D-alanyl-D-alanine carboxypeptidase n=1 Tax=Paraurantiacibacter namhicola TaxID=645517 RepID=A0A1C7D673_9SPHN|nr:serine hydrolase [Paraurantiacibacter namhicola]ANU06996.1 D-alanyl-D-alanine carboxypeptidase precursor [Paraurantiacibacter namhicola]